MSTIDHKRAIVLLNRLRAQAQADDNGRYALFTDEEWEELSGYLAQDSIVAARQEGYRDATVAEMKRTHALVLKEATRLFVAGDDAAAIALRNLLPEIMSAGFDHGK